MIVAHQPEVVAVDSLTPHPDNPRRGDVAAIAASITKHGFYGSLVAQTSTRHVLKGNHTLEALKTLDAEKVPVVFLDVDDDQAKAILLDDNHTSELGTFDEAGVAALLSSIADVDVELLATFKDDEIDAILQTGYGDDAASFLDGVGDEDVDEPDEDTSDAPAPSERDEDAATAMFNLSYTADVYQRQMILDAIKAWRDGTEGSSPTSTEALAGICSAWLISSGNAELTG